MDVSLDVLPIAGTPEKQTSPKYLQMNREIYE